MSKQYLKMADVFRDEMRVVGDSNNMIADDVGIIIGCYSGDKMAEYVLHAINSHDELVAEIERLRGELSVASNVLDEVDRVLSERIKNGAYDLDDISAEVSQAIERLNRNIGLLMLT